MAIKERKQITGTAAQIKGFAGHNGVLAYATDTKHLHVLSGTAGTATELANRADIPDITGKADTTYVNAELAKKQAKGDYATNASLTSGLAGKANSSHTHTIANVTGLQVDLTTIRESITNVSSKVDGIDVTLSPTYAKKQAILDACDKALNGANPVHAGDPTLDEIKLALATIQTQLGQLESRRYVKETGKNSDGTKWYRKWSDGWIEQGELYLRTGTESTIRKITFLTPFTDTNYIFIARPLYTTQTSWVVELTDSTGAKTFRTKTTTDVQGDISMNWYACGY